jgi:hypothetical protein
VEERSFALFWIDLVAELHPDRKLGLDHRRIGVRTE